MRDYTLPEFEEERLNALYHLNILDGQPEKEFQDIVKLASDVCKKPVAMISLLDKDRQWFKAKVGMDLQETPREHALGQYVVNSNNFFEVPDALADPELKNHPMVKAEPFLRYYAGAPLRLEEDICIGTLCVMDREPGRLSEAQKENLMALANNAMQLFLLRHKMELLSKSQDLLHALREINENYIRTHSDKVNIFRQMLQHALRVSNSTIGLIAEITDAQNTLKPISSIGLEPFYPSNGTGEFGIPDPVFLKSISSCQTCTSQFNPGSTNGTHFMSVPILKELDKPIGVFGLGRAKESYSQSDQEILQPFLSSCITLILTIKAEELKKQTEEENQKITQQLINAQSIAKTGSWEFRMDTSEMTWSEEQYRIFELPHADPKDLALLANQRMDQVQREKNLKIPRELALSGKPFTYKQKLNFEDGRTKTIIIKGNPVFNEAGKLSMIHGTCQDVTEQRLQALDLQRFFELSLDLLCIADANGKILKHSASFNEMLGYSDFELQGNSLFDLIHPEDLERAQAELKSLYTSGKLGNIHNRFMHKNGSEVILEWTAAYDAESKRIYASAKDITGKSELEELLIQSKIEAEKARAKDIFLANMSHEIRTPLNAIIGFNEILAQTSLNPDQRKKVEIISAASKNLSVIVNDILDLSKLESGKLELDVKPFRIENTCKQVIQLQTSRAKSKGIKLYFSYDNEIPELVKGDDTRLSQILINLISNAIKFTEKGHVELKVREASREGNQAKIIFSVADTGIGIPSDKIRKIFERFSQAETYTTRVYGGTGLGLSIVKSLIELHNGKISVKSRPGEGSVFSFSITYPISEENEDQTLEQADLNISEQAKLLSGVELLLVEDNEHNQLLAASYLEKYGVKLQMAGNGKQALEKLRVNHFDIIIMDLQMPIMDGITTTEEVRKTLKLSTPIIACSAHALASERKKCLESGMNDYIAKPYSEKTLLETLFHFLPNRTKSSEPKAESKILLNPAEIAHNGHLSTASNGQTEKPARSAPAWLEQAVMAKIPEDVRILAEAMENQDWKALEFKAHNLISSLSILHFSDGIDLSRKLETASRNQDQDNSILLGNELIDFLKKLKSED